jgi:hypothetical protein
MQPEDFTAPASQWLTHCQLCNGPHGLVEWSIPRVCCIKINIEREINGVVLTPDIIKSIILERTREGLREVLTLVDFHVEAPTYDMIALLYNKSSVGDEVYIGAKAYWKRWCHREYQKAIAQWMQRELKIPGEVAHSIAEFI